jgi:hypothetical protein
MAVVPRKPAVLGALLVAALASLVGGATRGESATEHSPARYWASFSLNGKHGSGFVDLSSAVGERVGISAGLIPEFGPDVFTTYWAKAQVSSGGVVANLGRFGSISVKFTRAGQPASIPARHFGCSGGDKLRWKGVFAGSVAFLPEPGWPRVSRRRIRRRGSLSFTPQWSCKRVPEPSGPPRRTYGNGIRLEAHDGGSRAFSVLGERPRIPPGYTTVEQRLPEFSTSWKGRIGRVQIEDSLIDLGGTAASLRFDEALTTATVEPPAPFYGSATLVRDPSGATHWSGTLGISFFGREVPLAGPTFSSSLISFPLHK